MATVKQIKSLSPSVHKQINIDPAQRKQDTSVSGLDDVSIRWNDSFNLAGVSFGEETVKNTYRDTKTTQTTKPPAEPTFTGTFSAVAPSAPKINESLLSEPMNQQGAKQNFTTIDDWTTYATATGGSQYGAINQELIKDAYDKVMSHYIDKTIMGTTGLSDKQYLNNSSVSTTPYAAANTARVNDSLTPYAAANTARVNDSLFSIWGNNGASIIIGKDGNVHIQNGISLTEASEQFWTNLGQESPTLLKVRIAKLEAEIAELKSNKTHETFSTDNEFDPISAWDRAMNSVGRV